MLNTENAGIYYSQYQILPISPIVTHFNFFSAETESDTEKEKRAQFSCSEIKSKLLKKMLTDALIDGILFVIQMAEITFISRRAAADISSFNI